MKRCTCETIYHRIRRKSAGALALLLLMLTMTSVLLSLALPMRIVYAEDDGCYIPFDKYPYKTYSEIDNTVDCPYIDGSFHADSIKEDNKSIPCCDMTYKLNERYNGKELMKQKAMLQFECPAEYDEPERLSITDLGFFYNSVDVHCIYDGYTKENPEHPAYKHGVYYQFYYTGGCSFDNISSPTKLEKAIKKKKKELTQRFGDSADTSHGNVYDDKCQNKASDPFFETEIEGGVILISHDLEKSDGAYTTYNRWHYSKIYTPKNTPGIMCTIDFKYVTYLRETGAMGERDHNTTWEEQQALIPNIDQELSAFASKVDSLDSQGKSMAQAFMSDDAIKISWENIEKVSENEEVDVEENDPIIQNDPTLAKKDPGDDPGQIINPDIIEGSKTDKLIAAIIAGLGGAVIAGGVVAGKKKKEPEEEDPVNYRMIVYKDFGDILRPGDEKVVYARIEQYKPIQEAKSFRNDLTAQIVCGSPDNVMSVTDGGIVTNGCDYRAAVVKVPEDCTANQAAVEFSLPGPGGVYNRIVVFKIENPMIVFGQENLGLPANALKNTIQKEKNGGELSGRTGDGEYYLPFGVIGMPVEGTKVSATLLQRCSTDSEGRFIEGSLDHSKGMPYTVKIIPDPKPEDAAKGVWNAVIMEVKDYELPAGTLEGIEMTVTAENGTPGTPGYVKAEKAFAIYRVHLGLVLTVEGLSIPCYSQLKESGKRKLSAQAAAEARKAEELRKELEAQVDYGKDKDTLDAATFIRGLPASSAATIEDLSVDPDENKLAPEDIEPVFGNGSLVLFQYREEDMSIVRIPVAPLEEEIEDEKQRGKIKVTVKQLAMDRYAHQEEAGKSHQDLIDRIDVRVRSTGKVTSNGAHLIQFYSMRIMDPPTRFVATITVSAKYKDKIFTTNMDVLLRSQPFREARNMKEEEEFIRQDEKIAERLIHIQSQIYSYAFGSLFSVYDLIDRMLEGHDRRFGYDRNQLMNVMSSYLGWLRGTFTGANARPRPVTLADDINACYAFIEGMRDNGGIIGRVALGIVTAGYSEYLFSAMKLSEETKAKVFACKGDEDFSSWDVIKMGVDEFGKQVVLELVIGGVQGFEEWGLASIGSEFMYARGIDIPGTLNKLNLLKKWDKSLQEKWPWYKKGDELLDKGMNFFNTTAKKASSGLEQMEHDIKKADDYIEDLLKKSKKNMTPEELLDVENYWKAMEDGMNDVVELKKAQLAMEKCTDPKMLKEAKVVYRKCADKVWTNKNALKQLQRSKGDYAQRMRAQFNEYRETLLDEVQREACYDVAKEIGRNADEVYVMNVSNGVNTDYKLGKKVPGDRDISFKQKVLSDKVGTTDLTIDQKIGERAVARRLYKKMNGKEADSIEEALKFMKEKDVTYVNPNNNATDKIFSHNLEGYEDLASMVGMVPNKDGSRNMVMNKKLMENDLHNLQINRAAVAHKGKEWFVHDAQKSLNTALEKQAAAANAVGEAKEALLMEARDALNAYYGQTVEGVRQITKQVDKIIEVRSMMRTANHALTQEALEIHRLALRVGEDIPPGVFTHILKKYYNMDLSQYAEYMASFLN